MTIFRQLYELEHGLKTVTRRVVKPGEKAIVKNKLSIGGITITDGKPALSSFDYSSRITAIHRNGRLAYEVGRDYAIVPKRGQSSIGRYQLVSIAQERLQDITEQSAECEGLWPAPIRLYEPRNLFYFTSVLPNGVFATAREGYEALWKSINTKAPYRWDDNPLVYVLTIQVLHINGKQVQP